ncbi:hypothetical protein [Oerskovia gallyi]|uniref:ATPase BadF/BadG/BcrA/BcrD type domain-containing protein n=1 Tax=Oerskovia gallyi TaxID=2762226 RepID=A0ABR8UWP6_9CELL|nr:hypothetical protein [Oerskovia gallyi]MBD7996965.1 hypothetical protein [Oerskovia gallyi]
MTSAQDHDPALPEARADARTAPTGPSRWIVAIDVGGSGSRLLAARLGDDTAADVGPDAHRTSLTGRPVAIGPGGSDVAPGVAARGPRPSSRTRPSCTTRSARASAPSAPRSPPTP